MSPFICATCAAKSAVVAAVSCTAVKNKLIGRGYVIFKLFFDNLRSVTFVG
ncbi:MAG: Uncharacterised protein [Polaribacter sejongensis]|jgi:hypothetical protein|nr:MAG: Uncharacterised protein [Polaribacter sejongensis]